MQEVYEFQAEINQLLSIIINTFYSNKDIFLRELISNAADAIDKIRHIELSSPDSVKNHLDEHQIVVRSNKDDNTLTIEDSGLGMSRDDLINNLGVIAKSGTKAFLETLSDSDKMSLIGQFGVGFYAAYLVADNVQVYSKRYDEDKCFKWESQAGGTFTVTESDIDLVRGTRIVLFLKPDNTQYTEKEKICELVKKHNDFIEYPIMVEYEVEEEVEQEEKEEEIDVDADTDTKDKDVDADTDAKDADEAKVEDVEDGDVGEDGEKTKEVVKEKVKVWVKKQEKANNQKPLWHKPSSEVTKEEYESLYKCLTNDWNTYLVEKHFSVEGQLEFKSILYIPKTAPFDMFSSEKKQNNIKLYVKKVFITDDAEKLIPNYLSFVKGVVDTDDLPLNISREILQENKIVKQIKKAVTKRVFEMINDLDEANFVTFYENFSKNIKLGVYDDTANRDKLMELLRYPSTHHSEKLTSLSDYVSRMKEGDNKIYYITGESRKVVEESPFIKRVDGEVLFMVDAIDEYIMQQIRSYKDYTFVCITKVGADSCTIDDAEKEKYKSFCEAIHEAIGKNNVNVVKMSKYDKSIPCTVLTDAYGHSANMERIMKAQTLNVANPMMMSSSKTLELNVNNPLVCSLYDVYLAQDSKIKKDVVNLMYETALLSSGFSITQPASYSQKVFKIIQLGLTGCDDEDDVEAEVDADPVPELQEPAEDQAGIVLESLD